MRNEQEMMAAIERFAQKDNRIRLVTLEGSRTNDRKAPDRFQDYDISFFVTDMEPYKTNDHWLDSFGRRLMMQKPEDMELFPPELGNWFSYLILFEDGNKLDLTLIPLDEHEEYFANGDGLAKVLLDKDGLVREQPLPSDRHYWIQQPNARQFDDCCNEFWMVSTYVLKGLGRNEILFAIDHLNNIVRPNLLRMMAWMIGLEKGCDFSLGKNYTFIDRYLPPEDWQALLSTYSLGSRDHTRQALQVCHALFRRYAKTVAAKRGYVYPDYDEAVARYAQASGLPSV